MPSNTRPQRDWRRRAHKVAEEQIAMYWQMHPSNDGAFAITRAQLEDIIRTQVIAGYSEGRKSRAKAPA